MKYLFFDIDGILVSPMPLINWICWIDEQSS